MADRTFDETLNRWQAQVGEARDRAQAEIREARSRWEERVAARRSGHAQPRPPAADNSSEEAPAARGDEGRGEDEPEPEEGGETERELDGADGERGETGQQRAADRGGAHLPGLVTKGIPVLIVLKATRDAAGALARLRRRRSRSAPRAAAGGAAAGVAAVVVGRALANAKIRDLAVHSLRAGAERVKSARA